MSEVAGTLVNRENVRLATWVMSMTWTRVRWIWLKIEMDIVQALITRHATGTIKTALL